jgi:hypothetical protein
MIENVKTYDLNKALHTSVDYLGSAVPLRHLFLVGVTIHIDTHAADLFGGHTLLIC